MPNRLSRAIGRVSKLPGLVRTRALTTVLRTAVPFLGASGVIVEELTESRCIVVVRNRRRVRNHIGGIHAAATTLVAETATGMVVGMNVPDDRAPVVKTIHVEFKKRAKGGLRVTAELTAEQRRAIVETTKGEVEVAARIVDDEGKEPVVATMVWAWTPKRRG
jgi:acyl-coenzyme A thioesterase PaaI-like protein